MSYQQKDNAGSLFKNTEKTNERGPDYSGTATIDGTEFFMDAWLKKSDSGRTWMSFSFKPKQKQSSKPAQPRQQTRRDDSDLPPF